MICHIYIVYYIKIDVFMLIYCFGENCRKKVVEVMCGLAANVIWNAVAAVNFGNKLKTSGAC